MAIKIPRPSSDLVIDPQTGRITRVWFIYLEQLGVIGGPLQSLGPGQILIGNDTGTPEAQTISGDILLASDGVTTLQATINVQEIAQDAVGAILSDTARIELTYDDAGNFISADLVTGSVANAYLADMAADTFKGRADGAGTGVPQDLTVAQAVAILNTADQFTFTAGGLVKHFVDTGITATIPDGYTVCPGSEFQILGTGELQLLGDAELAIL